MQYSKLLLLVLTCISFFSCNKREDNKSEALSLIKVSSDVVKLNPKEGLVYYNDEPFTGISEELYENSKPRASVSYLNGKKHGVSIKWFVSGLKSYEANYMAGRLSGETKTWWKNGNLRSISRHENGVIDGLQEQWYLSGAKFKEMNIAEGKEEGMQKSWRENGKLYNNYEARNGRIFGLKRAGLCYELDDENIVYKD